MNAGHTKDGLNYINFNARNSGSLFQVIQSITPYLVAMTTLSKELLHNCILND